VNELDTLFERLYEDRAAKKITDERFEKLSAKYEDEQAALSEALAATERQIAEIEKKAANADRFIALVRRYTTGIEELTPAIVHEFIDKIIVHEPESKRKDRTQKIDIIYNNIGAFCISGAPSESEETLAATPPARLPLVASL
jgi:predicted ribosome quality control (RQC) complex YloA/Tae2 family protein